MATRMQQRRGTQAQWTAANPVLAAGEIGFEIDNNRFKVGDGTNTWSAISYFVDIESVLGGVSGTDLPVALDTLNEIAAALNDDAGLYNTLSNLINTGIESVGNNLSVHAGDATNVHGVADMTQLTTTNYVANVIDVHNQDTTSVHGIANTAALATVSDIATHSADTSDVHGIANTNAIVYTTDSRLSDERTPSSSSVTASKIASDAIETAKIANNAVTAAKLATDSVETAKIKDAAVTGAKIADNAISQSHLSDDSVGTNEIGGSAVTAAKLATDAVETAKIKDAAVTGAKIAEGAVTKTMVGLGNVDNTSDANKPVSTATQTALDLKANLAGPTFTGTTTANTLVVDGNLTVNGNTFAMSATTITIEDNLVQLAHENAANTVDLGIVVAYNDGTAKHSGIVRDVSDDKWKLFKGVTTEPTTTVNFGQGSLDTLAVAGIEATTATIGDVSNTELQYLNGVTSAVQTQIDTKAPIASPTFTGLVTVAANGIAYTDGTQTKEGVPSRTPIVSKTDSYTLSATSERDSLIEVNKSSAATITIPLNSAVGFPIGTTLDVLQTGTGQVTIAGDAGVTVNATPGLKLRTQWSSVTLFKRAENSWVAFGDLTA